MNQVAKDSFGFVEIDFRRDQTEQIFLNSFSGDILTESNGIVSGDRVIHGSNVESDCVPSL